MEDEVVARLVRTLVEDPDDLATRAVLADRFLELDDPRGRLVQLDLELRNAGGKDPDRVIADVIGKLVSTHGRRLAGDIADLVERYNFAGGFIDHITATVPVFKQHGERWFRAQPIRAFTPKPWNAATIKALAKCPHLALVRTLVLERSGPNRVGPVALEPLAKAKLDRLESLEMTWVMLDGADGEAFLRDLRAPRLRKLRFGSGFLSASALRGLAANHTLCAQLEELRVAHTIERFGTLEPDADAIADEAIAAIELPRLATLDVGYTWFATEARTAALLAKAPLLESLEIDRTNDELLRATATRPHLRKLFSISVPPSPAALAQLLALPSLTEILLRTTDWSPEQIEEIIDTLLALPTSHPLRHVHMMYRGSRAPELKGRFG